MPNAVTTNKKDNIHEATLNTLDMIKQYWLSLKRNCLKYDKGRTHNKNKMIKAFEMNVKLGSKNCAAFVIPQISNNETKTMPPIKKSTAEKPFVPLYTFNIFYNTFY